MVVAAILVMWPRPFEQTFVPTSYGVSIWNLSLIGPVVSEEKMFENVDGRRSDWYTINSPMSLRLRWANKGRRGRFRAAGGDLGQQGAPPAIPFYGKHYSYYNLKLHVTIYSYLMPSTATCTIYSYMIAFSATCTIYSYMIASTAT